MMSFWSHTKKRRSLAKAEQALVRLIERGASLDRLLKAALKIRDGRVRAMREKQMANPMSSVELQAVFQKHRAELAALQTHTAESVLSEYMPGGEPMTTVNAFSKPT